jgi:hypothetical protein
MTRRSRTAVLILTLMTGNAGEAAPVVDKTPAATPATETVVARLPPTLQKLLTEEMLAINTASQKIVAALASGDSAVVAEQAQGIHDSFILEKKLGSEDREALEKALPQGFLALDAALHGKAQRLANVARRGDLELENFYFGRMIEACQDCHSRFATGKFPDFAPQAQGGRK